MTNAPVTLLSPTKGQTVDAQAARFSWIAPAGALQNEIIIARDADFNDVWFSSELPATSEITLYDLFSPQTNDFFWRIRSRSSHNVEESQPAAFKFGYEESVIQENPPRAEAIPTPSPAIVPPSILPNDEPTSLAMALSVVGVMACGLLVMALMLFLPHL